VSQRSRLLALPLVMLCVLAYLGSAAHFLLVQHSTCLEHGDMLHGASAERGDAPMQVRPSFADKRVTRTDAVVSGHDADAHCTYVFLRRVVSPSAGVMLSPEAPALPGRVLGMAHGVVEPPVAWLHLAPKSSPPRA
jgi:hypothetical protein